MVLVAYAKDDGPGSLNSARLAAELAERAGNEWARVLSHLALSCAGALDGQWDLAIAGAEEAIQTWRTRGFFGDFAALALAAHALELFTSERWS